MVSALDLNLKHLRAVVAIGAHGSVTAAAAAVGLSQPALTQGLAGLERVLGVSLFDRTIAGVQPTDAGAALIARVETAFDLLETSFRPAGGAAARRFSHPSNLVTATQIRSLLGLAAAGSYVGAAHLVGISQPAVNRSVRDIEQITGAALTDRRGRGVMLTPAGRRLARGARLALRELEAGLEDMRGAGSDGGRVLIGAMPLSRARVVPAAISALLRERPHATVDVVEGGYSELIEPLRDGVIDLMVGALRDPGPVDLEQTRLFADRLVVVAGARHPLAGRETVGTADLAGFPWLIGRHGSPLRAVWTRMFDAAGIPRPPSPVECGSVMIARTLLKDADLLTLLSMDQIEQDFALGRLVVLKADVPQTGRIIGVTTRKFWRPTDVQSRYLALLKAASAR